MWEINTLPPYIWANSEAMTALRCVPPSTPFYAIIELQNPVEVGQRLVLTSLTGTLELTASNTPTGQQFLADQPAPSIARLLQSQPFMRDYYVWAVGNQQLHIQARWPGQQFLLDLEALMASSAVNAVVHFDVGNDGHTLPPTVVTTLHIRRTAAELQPTAAQVYSAPTAWQVLEPIRLPLREDWQVPLTPWLPSRLPVVPLSESASVNEPATRLQLNWQVADVAPALPRLEQDLLVLPGSATESPEAYIGGALSVADWLPITEYVGEPFAYHGQSLWPFAFYVGSSEWLPAPAEWSVTINSLDEAGGQSQTTVFSLSNAVRQGLMLVNIAFILQAATTQVWLDVTWDGEPAMPTAQRPITVLQTRAPLVQWLAANRLAQWQSLTLAGHPTPVGDGSRFRLEAEWLNEGQAAYAAHLLGYDLYQLEPDGAAVRPVTLHQLNWEEKCHGTRLALIVTYSLGQRHAIDRVS